jgi:hypothetical protein
LVPMCTISDSLIHCISAHLKLGLRWVAYPAGVRGRAAPFKPPAFLASSSRHADVEGSERAHLALVGGEVCLPADVVRTCQTHAIDETPCGRAGVARSAPNLATSCSGGTIAADCIAATSVRVLSNAPRPWCIPGETGLLPAPPFRTTAPTSSPQVMVPRFVPCNCGRLRPIRAGLWLRTEQ